MREKERERQWPPRAPTQAIPPPLRTPPTPRGPIQRQHYRRRHHQHSLHARTHAQVFWAFFVVICWFQLKKSGCWCFAKPELITAVETERDSCFGRCSFWVSEVVLYSSVLVATVPNPLTEHVTVLLPGGRATKVVGICLGLVGDVVLFWTLDYLGKQWTITVTTVTEHKMITGGPYRSITFHWRHCPPSASEPFAACTQARPRTNDCPPPPTPHLLPPPTHTSSFPFTQVRRAPNVQRVLDLHDRALRHDGRLAVLGHHLSQLAPGRAANGPR